MSCLPKNTESVTNQAVIVFAARPQLPKAAYVPEPKPVKGKYDVGVYYFPGWQSRSQWQPIERFPERKPILGWYREGDPEVADWQIKWAVEHGITYFAYDWYWSQGARHLEHGLHNGYFNARYKSMLKFCLLWANHNAPKTHSIDDSLAVTRYWITNYFQRPEYYRIEGKPMVIIFSPYNYKNDMGIDGVNKAFEAMRDECRKAGLPGLYLAACVGNAHQVDGENYDAVTAYKLALLLGISGSENQVPYREPRPRPMCSNGRSCSAKIPDPFFCPCVADGTAAPGTEMPPSFAPVERPSYSSNTCAMPANSSKQTPRIPASCRRYSSKPGTSGGEGSYIEPHKEFGFGYLGRHPGCLCQHH